MYVHTGGGGGGHARFAFDFVDLTYARVILFLLHSVDIY